VCCRRRQGPHASKASHRQGVLLRLTSSFHGRIHLFFLHNCRSVLTVLLSVR
jgi:hypothetical protein